MNPLADYRADELARMHLNSYGFDPSYYVARQNFSCKVPKSRTPLTLARHRSRPSRLRGQQSGTATGQLYWRLSEVM